MTRTDKFNAHKEYTNIHVDVCAFLAYHVIIQVFLTDMKGASAYHTGVHCSVKSKVA